MSLLIKLIRYISIGILVILQQGLLIVLGILSYAQNINVLAIVFWSLCLPMVYVNYQTYKLILKHGIINFTTMNSDTSEIDVPKGNRWYDEK
ncbi:MAG: hypothetical protein AAF487_12030 [Bacteroidota bacterium]